MDRSLKEMVRLHRMPKYSLIGDFVVSGIIFPSKSRESTYAELYIIASVSNLTPKLSFANNTEKHSAQEGKKKGLRA